MAETKEKIQNTEVGYGFADDEQKVSQLHFGLNAGNTFLTKFEWIPNGGANGTEQEALDIVFKIGDTEKSYRMFPVTEAFIKGSQEKTKDVNSPEFKDAQREFNSRIVHILSAFVTKDVIKTALARPISNFKDFCVLCKKLLPKTTPTIPLDIFLQYQWAISPNKNVTYLEIPKKMSYGYWLCKAVEPVGGVWKKVLLDNFDESTQTVLSYVDEANNVHPFVKNGWFMSSNFAKQQKAESSSDDSDSSNRIATETDNTDNEVASDQQDDW